ncbi:MAG TPA: tRNA (adenosine(37)-N6)-threonylcarbamoyltransferase complex dimerization subunit type 1 TsaB [Eubacteriales bacterium]|nr:tRNA (adenosine(37)-N6)-threonylcarbamoyltransferase complex dimerization subunit type 1 TsaB [Eubacteriales bacterium]
MEDKYVLIIDTVTPNMYVVLVKNGDIFEQKIIRGNKNHSRTLTKTIGEVLRKDGVEFNQIGVFACDIGPGSFTGIRIGIAAVKGYTTVFPCAQSVTFTSLELLAEKTKSENCLMDAGRDLFYYQKFCGGIAIAQPTLIEKAQANLYIGEKAALFDENMDFANELVTVTQRKILAKEFAEELTPVYLRKPQAQEERDRKIVKEIAFTQKEIDEMLEIEKQCFAGEAWNRSDFDISYKDGLITLGVFEADKLIGYGMIYLASDEADLCTIGVLPQYRKKGYGGAIMTALAEAAKKRNVKKITLEVSKGNDDAIKMYKSFGFTIAGERKNYYTNSNFGDNNAYIMILQF